MPVKWMPQLSPGITRGVGGFWRLDLLSLLLLGGMGIVLGAILFPTLAPELRAGTYWWMAAASILGVVFSILVRSVVYLGVARVMKARLRGITLYLFGPVLDTRAGCARPGAEALLAGSHWVSSLTLAGLFLSAFASGFGERPPLAQLGVVLVLALYNAAGAVLYLLPGYPLDGGRLLRAALERWGSNQGSARRVAALAGRIVAALLVMSGGVMLFTAMPMGGVSLFVAGVLVYSAERTTRESSSGATGAD
jgi:Zn-dependent protease